MATQTWLGRFTIDADAKDFTLENASSGATAIALTTPGPYYMVGYDAESTDQFCEHISTKMQASFTGANCNFNYETGKVKFTFGENTNVTWDDTDLRDILGFTANLTSASTYTATNEAKYVWRPDRSFSDHPVTFDNLIEPESSTMVYRSKDGTVNSVVGTQTNRAQVEYTMLDDARVIVPSTGTVNQEFEQFFKDVLHAGQPIRLFLDDTATTSADYVTVIVGDGENPVGSFGDYASRHVRAFNGLWDISIPLLEFK